MLETLTADGLWPHVHDAPNFKAMCARLNDLGVLGLPAKVKRPLARELCGRLGFEPSDGSFVDQLRPGRHNAERAEKQRAVKAASMKAYLATPEGRERHNVASRATHAAARATEEGREKARVARRATMAAYHQPGGRYETDPLYRIACTIRAGVKRIPQATETTKTGSTLVLPCGTKVLWRNLLGCTFAEAKAIIEGRFLPGMTWKNQGKVWHLDHRMPLKAYQDNPTLDVLKVVQHIDNLWPLWGPENLEKGDDYCPAELAALLDQRAAA